MRDLKLISGYQSKLSLIETEIAIKFVKDTFERKLANHLNLTRVSAPLFVEPKTGLNDNLNGFERAVSFDILDLKRDVEIVQSLAKWKRNALKNYGFIPNTGLYTDMNAIRRDEELDTFHSVYVDQWDWEKIIKKENRTLTYLMDTVKTIFQVLKDTEKDCLLNFPALKPQLPEEITFVSTKELFEMYPSLSPKERENQLLKDKKAVFLYQIGWPLENGEPHDGRAADYDDWNLNGDILVWYPLLQVSLELSSMGIRVDKDSLEKQIEFKHEEAKLYSPYSKNILSGELPLTVGGGIGQSRLCMFLLQKAHIGEVQSSVWSEEDIQKLAKCNIHLL